MNLVSIRKKTGDDIFINADNICSIYSDGKEGVTIRMSCGNGICTMFTDVEHAADYINKSLRKRF
jgi:hypothetical protein